MKRKRKKYTPGCEDIERVFNHLEKKYKEAKRKEWLNAHTNVRKKSKQKEVIKSEDNSKS